MSTRSSFAPKIRAARDFSDKEHHHLVQIKFRVQIEVKELLELGNVVASNRNPILLAVVRQICDSVKRVLLQTILEVLPQKFAINWAKSNYGL